MNGIAEQPVLRLEGITKAYPRVVANDGVNIDLRAGEIHSIVGENGAGKTTLMGIAYGLQRPDAGRTLVDGQPVGIRSPRDALDLGIGYVQQHFSLIPTLTVAQNLVLALRTSADRIAVRDGSARVRELSRRFGLDVEPDTVVEEVGVGQQQRAELLKALARNARVLLLDEPNALLTPQEWEELAGILRRLADAGVGIFLVSHKLEEVLRISDRISVLRRGRLVATIPAREATNLRLGELMVGDLSAAEAEPPASERPADGSALLEVDDLWVASDRGGHAVRGVSLSIHAGEVLGIAGVEGSGQVELTEALAGARAASRGAIRMDGRDVTGMSLQARRRAGAGHVPADRATTGLIPTLSVADNLLLPVAGAPPFSRWGVLNRRAARDRARALIDRFDIRVPGPDVPAGALSGGNQQKLILARELSGQPRILLCCYPTRGLDFAATQDVRREILSHRDEGAAILFASVDLDELLAMTDRILVLHQGSAAGEVRASEATAEQLGLLMGGAAA